MASCADLEPVSGIEQVPPTCLHCERAISSSAAKLVALCTWLASRRLRFCNTECSTSAAAGAQHSKLLEYHDASGDNWNCIQNSIRSCIRQADLRCCLLSSLSSFRPQSARGARCTAELRASVSSDVRMHCNLGPCCPIPADMCVTCFLAVNVIPTSVL